jgi:catechol 2,3-dioxygenase-like lactoylglutathione lyase family enzyme
MIKAIHHVQIAVAKELEIETIEFYRNVLCLKEIPKPENLKKNGGAWFEAGLQQFHIAPENVPKEYNSDSKRHVCFLVENLEEAQKSLIEKGVEIIPDNQPVSNFKRFYFRDPAGNRVELTEFTY